MKNGLSKQSKLFKGPKTNHCMNINRVEEENYPLPYWIIVACVIVLGFIVYFKM